MSRYIFFVSTGRTGTHFVAEFFDEYGQDIAGYHEPKPAFKRRGYELVSREPTLYEKLYFKSFRTIRFWKSGHQHYVEANNCLFSAINLIRDCFPGAKIIHMVRDGRDVVRSYINAQKRYAHTSSTDLLPDHFPDDPYQDLWSDMNTFQRTTWFWVRVNEVIERQDPDRRIYFEDFFQPPHDAVFDLMDTFPELNVPEETVRQAFQEPRSSSKSGPIKNPEDWSEKQREAFWSIAGESMQHYGYKQ